MMDKIPLIVVTGPTASGKTALAVSLATRFDAEVVSADSMQIYKYMNIGTAKPTTEERRGIPHHMIDIIEPWENFSVAEYCDAAKKVIHDIRARGKNIILVGGTGLYIDSLINGADFGDGGVDFGLRKELGRLADIYGGEYLLKKLAEFDKESAEKIHPNNTRRIIRAIEFYKTNGVPISQSRNTGEENIFRAIKFIIDYPRETLYERINERVDRMAADGLFEEAESLYRSGALKGTALAGIGYKEVVSYLRGFSTYDETIALIKRGTRRYAKRQLTWFRRGGDIIYLNPAGNMLEDAADKIRDFLKND